MTRRYLSLLVRRITTNLVLALLVPSLLCGQEPQISNYLNNLRSVPIEYATDMVVPLLDSQRLNPKSKLALIQGMIARAKEAVDQYPIMLVPSPSSGSYEYVFKAISQAQLVDGLSIRLRLIKRFEATPGNNANELRRMLLAIRPPINSQSCNDLYIPTFDHYYAVARNAFPTLHSLLSMRPVSTVQEVADLAKVLAEGDFRESELRSALKQIGETFRHVNTDDRTFTTAETRLGINRSFAKLLSTSSSSALMSETGVIEAYRDYLLRQLNKPRCSDSLKFNDLVPEGGRKVINIEEGFNALARSAGVSLIDKQALHPIILQTPVTNVKRATNLTLQGRELAAQYRREGSPESRAAILQYIKSIASRPAMACEVCDFLSKVAVVVAIIIKTAPIENDVVCKLALRTLADIMTNSPLKLKQPGVWLIACRQLVNLLHLPNEHFRIEVRRAVATVKDPILSLYVESDLLFHFNTDYDETPLSNFTGIRPLF